MADRTAAGLLGRVFEVLAERSNADEAQAIAREMWPLVQRYDFTEDQMCADDALRALGLLRDTGNDVEYGPA